MSADEAIGLRWLGHATVLLELDGRRVLTDPFLRRRLGPLERHGPLPDPAALGPLDLVVISHGHHDHLDPASLGALPGRPAVVVPRGLGTTVARAVRGPVIEVDIGDTVEVAGVLVRVVPARHWVTPGAPRATPVGYVLGGDRRVYFAGDTGPFADLTASVGRVDLALLPVWTWGPHLGPGHLGPRAAAEVLAALAAPAAVPIHWGTLYPRALHRAIRRPLDEPGPRFAAHAGRIAPVADVRVPQPGEGVTFLPRPAHRSLPERPVGSTGGRP